MVRFLMGHYRAAFDGIARGGRALDIGVGGGRHAKLLNEFGFEVSGIDISEEGLRQTRNVLEKLGMHAALHSASMAALPFESEFFDVVVSYGVFNYGASADMVSAIRELHRVLQPGRRAFVVTRTTSDYRFGKGKELEPGTFQLDISDTSEEGTVQHFLSEADVYHRFAAFSEIRLEKTETTFALGKKTNSDWLIDLRK